MDRMDRSHWEVHGARAVVVTGPTGVRLSLRGKAVHVRRSTVFRAVEMEVSASRKTAIIMFGIMIAEGWVLTLAVQSSTIEHVIALYAPTSAGWLACTLAVGFSAVFIWYAVRAFPLIGRRFFEPHALKLLAIPFALVTGSVEELWFRKTVMDAVAARSGHALDQVVVSAVLFGLVHAIWGAFASRWRVALGSMLATSGLGAALAIVYLAGDRHVAPCIWSHIVINLALEPWLLFAAVSNGTRIRTDANVA